MAATGGPSWRGPALQEAVRGARHATSKLPRCGVNVSLGRLGRSRQVLSEAADISGALSAGERRAAGAAFTPDRHARRPPPPWLPRLDRAREASPTQGVTPAGPPALQSNTCAARSDRRARMSPPRTRSPGAPSLRDPRRGDMPPGLCALTTSVSRAGDRRVPTSPLLRAPDLLPRGRDWREMRPSGYASASCLIYV
jgi:hypothetical protein